MKEGAWLLMPEWLYEGWATAGWADRILRELASQVAAR